MSVEGFAVFDTPLGAAGLAWTGRGISGLELPDPDATRVRARLRRRSGAATESQPPTQIQQVIDTISTLLSGDSSVSLTSVQLDLAGVPEFDRRVYELTRRIPVGQTRTYGALARELGDVKLARDVGQALARNPFPIVVPCHRVIAADGRLGGFSARGGVAAKQRLLALERANVGWQLPLVPG